MGLLDNPKADAKPIGEAMASAKNGTPTVDDILSDPAVKAAIAKPEIDNTHDVPYLAGASNEGTLTHIDRRVPQFDPKLKDNQGELADLWKYLNIHEQTEREAMARGMPYEAAHLDIATKAERAAVEADGVNWGKYERIMDGYLNGTEHENPKNPPKDLYLKPYPHDKQEILRRHEANSK